jgi:hypothetical protein
MVNGELPGYSQPGGMISIQDPLWNTTEDLKTVSAGIPDFEEKAIVPRGCRRSNHNVFAAFTYWDDDDRDQKNKNEEARPYFLLLFHLGIKYRAKIYKSMLQ